jgi:hypothetical protein
METPRCYDGLPCHIFAFLHAPNKYAENDSGYNTPSEDHPRLFQGKSGDPQ